MRFSPIIAKNYDVISYFCIFGMQTGEMLMMRRATAYGLRFPARWHYTGKFNSTNKQYNHCRGYGLLQ